ncbi:MAG: YdcF family protein [Halanaerobiales bacterium]|nr:YdcF family protein [Halanaerobiales bacterium]
MLALEKIVASIIMPPGLFVLLLLLLTIYLFKKSDSGLIKLTSLFLLLFFFLLSTAFGVQLLLHPLENYAEKISVNAFERHPIVVLGGGLNYYSETEAKPSVHSLQRLVKGYQLHRRLNTPLIYSGGVALGQDRISEADAAGELLESLGMDLEFYISEDQAQTTFENAAYLKRWIEENGVKKVYLVTSAYHILRSAAVFEAQNIDFLAVHSGFISDHQFSWLDYLPNRGALTSNLSALHEWVGLAWYYLRGRI